MSCTYRLRHSPFRHTYANKFVDSRLRELRAELQRRIEEQIDLLIGPDYNEQWSLKWQLKKGFERQLIRPVAPAHDCPHTAWYKIGWSQRWNKSHGNRIIRRPLKLLHPP